MKVVSIQDKPQEEYILDASEDIYSLLNDLILNHSVAPTVVVGILEECKFTYLSAGEEEE